ncbi:hypothetical protein NL676_022364 [Syzygium grande]|nr:hypothetical protein NL676_022364 [Syzygium grande]
MSGNIQFRAKRVDDGGEERQRKEKAEQIKLNDGDGGVVARWGDPRSHSSVGKVWEGTDSSWPRGNHSNTWPVATGMMRSLMRRGDAIDDFWTTRSVTSPYLSPCLFRVWFAFPFLY